MAGINIKEFAELKKFVEDEQRQADKAAGALEQLAIKLKKFDCEDLEAAEGKLAELEHDGKKLAKRYAAELEQVKSHKRWKERNRES